MSEKPVEKKNNTLTMDKTIKLCDLLRSVRDKFVAERPSNREAAEYLSKRLGFLVTDRNVASACEATGVHWKSRAQTLSREFAGLLYQMCVAITEIQKTLNLDPSPAIREFLDSRNGHEEQSQA